MTEANETPVLAESSRHVKIMKSILLVSGLMWVALGVGYSLGAIEFHLPKEPERHMAMQTPAGNMPIPLFHPDPTWAKRSDCGQRAVLCSEWETDHPAKALQALSGALGADLKKDKYKVHVEVSRLLDTADIAPAIADILPKTRKN